MNAPLSIFKRRPLKLGISRAAANTLGITLAATRVFMMVAVDGAYLGNSGWLCALIGFVLALPAYFACDIMLKRGAEAQTPQWRVGGALFMLIAIYETAALIRMITNTTSYSELSTVSAVGLSVVMLIIVLYVIMKNGDGVGNAARLWLFAAPALLLIVVIAQLPIMEINWLAPIFGPGYKYIALGGVRAAGYLAFPAALHAISGEKTAKRVPGIKTLLTSTAIAVALLAAHGALAPPMMNPSADRTYMLDLLLANGRVPISLQFPLLMLWYLSLLLALGGYAFAAAATLQRAIPALGGRLCALITLAGSGAIVFTGIAEARFAQFVADWEFVALALGFSIMSIVYMKKGAAK